jgi:hypothetical protein
MTAAPIPCRWCGRACRTRRGGSPRVLCTPGCRMAFHAASRRWAEKAVASGMLTIAELRKADPAACTLLSSRVSGAEVSQRLSPAGPAHAVWPDALTITVALDRITAMQLRELTWGGSDDSSRAVDEALDTDCDHGAVAPSINRLSTLCSSPCSPDSRIACSW